MRCDNVADLKTERAFRCSKCNSLFDMVTDYARIKINKPDTLKKIFQARMVPGPKPDQSSDVWRFRDLIWPELPTQSIVTLGEGNTPIVPAGRRIREWIGDDVDVWFDQEGKNPSGSFKDRGMTVLVTCALLSGVPCIVCISTGDTAPSLASYASSAGIPCVVLLPEGKVTPAQLAQCVMYGARVIVAPTDFDGLVKIFFKLVELGAYPGNSLHPARIAGHMSTVFHIAMYFKWRLPDWIVLPVGNGSNASSTGLGMRRMRHVGLVSDTSRILGCQTEQANPLARSFQPSLITWGAAYRDVKAGDTIATACQIGAPVSASKVMREVTLSDGSMQTATEADIFEAMLLCNRDGLPVCPQTGIAIAGLRQAVQNGIVEAGSKVVIVSTADALKFPLSEQHVEKAIERASEPTVSCIAKMLKL